MATEPTLNFFYFPRACSLAPHIILEEVGLPYQRHLVDLRKEENLSEKYLKLNPKGAIPALVVNETILTETQAILTYLGDLVPEKQLIPSSRDFLRYRARDVCLYLLSTTGSFIITN